MSGIVICDAMLKAIAEKIPDLRKGSIDDGVDDIVRPSVTIRVPGGTPEWNGDGSIARVKCSPLVTLAVHSMFSAEVQKKDAMALEIALARALHGLEPQGCEELQYEGWKDATSQAQRDIRITVLVQTYTTYYEINLNDPDPILLDAIWTTYTDPVDGQPLAESQANFEHGDTP